MHTKLRSILVATCLLSASILPTTVLANGPEGAPSTPAEEFMESCIQGGINAGASPHEAQPYCQCALEQIMSKYSPSEFVELVNSTPGQVPPALEPILASCRESVAQ